MARGRAITQEEERKVLQLAGHGMKAREIADFLGLGRSTVCTIMNGTRQEYNERHRLIQKAIRNPEETLEKARHTVEEQLRMETPEAPLRMEGDPAHLLVTPQTARFLAEVVREQMGKEIRIMINEEKQSAWRLVYSAMLQAIRDGRKGADACEETQ